VLLLLFFGVLNVFLLTIGRKLFVQVALDFVEVLALDGDVTSSMAVITFQMQRSVIVWVFPHHKSEFLILILGVYMLLEDGFEELMLV